MPGDEISVLSDRLVRQPFGGTIKPAGPVVPVGVLTHRAALDIDVLRRLGGRLAGRPEVHGVPRAEVDVPISPSGQVSDAVVYEDHAEPTKHYWLPRYRLRQRHLGRYEISFEDMDGAWRAILGLETYPAPEIEAQVATATVLPHVLTMTVTSGSGVRRTYPVAEVTERDTGRDLVLHLTTEERDALLRAFTLDAERAVIEVSRSITVATPVAAEQDPATTMVGEVAPQGGMSSLLLPVINLRSMVGEVAVPIEHVEPPPPALERLASTRVFAMKPDIARTRFDTSLPADRIHPRIELPPIVIAPPVVVDPAPPPPTPPPAEPRFTVTTSTLVDTIPLRFDAAVHPYLFPGSLAPEAREEYRRITIRHGDGPAARTHLYYQDLTQPDLFLYLPDVFLLGQLPDPPHGPELCFSVGRSAEDPGTSIAVMSAHLVPQTSFGRLHDARRELADHIPTGTRRRPRLEPLIAAATCRLELPGGAVVTEEAPDLVSGWWLTETFPFDGLQEAYAVLTGDSGATSALMRGQVTVALDDGPPPQVPVELRLDRLATPALSWFETRVEGTDEVDLLLRNEGSSTLHVPELPGWILRGPVVANADVTGPELPLDLAPGAELALHLAPRRDLKDRGRVEAALDLTGVRTLVDPETAIEQTLDRRVTRLPRQVRVITTADALGQTGDPARDISLIGLELEGAPPVTLDATTLSVDALVPVPLLDLLLDRSSGSYRLRQTVVLKSGAQTVDGEWRTTDRGLLAVPLP